MYSFSSMYPKNPSKRLLKNHIKIEDNVVTERMPSSSAYPSTLLPHEHESTFYPPLTTIQTTAEITTTFEPFTTTLRILDATIAQVATMVDKVEHK